MCMSHEGFIKCVCVGGGGGGGAERGSSFPPCMHVMH